MARTARFLLVGPVMGFGLMAFGLNGQEPGLQQSELQLTKVAELSSRAGIFEPSRANSVAQFSDRSFVVSPLFVEPHLLRYAPDGRLLSAYNRLGSGPGEFESSPLVFVGRGDTLLAVERNRLMRFSPELSPLSTIRIATRAVSTLLLISDGGMAANGRQRLDPGTVSPVSLLAVDGTLRKSLEPIGTEFAVGATLLTEGSGGGFWLMRSNESEIRRRSSDGELEFRVEIQRDWFEPWTEFLPGEGINVPPRPYNSSISEHPGSLLLLTTWVADQEWEPAGRVSGRFRPHEEDTSDTWDTVIEFVDLRTGEVLASERTDLALSKVEGTSDLFHSCREEKDGHVTIEIWKAALSLGQRFPSGPQ